MLLFIKTLFLNIINNDDSLESASDDNIKLSNDHIIQYYQRLFNIYDIKYFNTNVKFIANQLQFDDMSFDQFKTICEEHYTNVRLTEDRNAGAQIFLLSYYAGKKLNSYVNFIKFHKISIIFTLCYIVLNIVLFILIFRPLYQFNNVMDNIKIYKAIAKGSAEVILLNSFIIVCPFLSYIYKIINYIYIPYHLGKILHYVAFISIFIFSIIHTICHFILITHVYDLKNTCVYDALELSRLNLSTNFESYFTLLPYQTGIILLLILLSFIGSVIVYVKQIIRYNLFYTIHVILMYSYFICIIVHGSMNWFKSSRAMYWCIPILFLFLFDKKHKIFYLTKIRIAILELSLNRYIKLTIPKTGMLHKNFINSSMTLDVNIPQLSKIEWHKFTITTAPGDDNIVLYIQIVGKWTSDLQQLYISNPTNTIKLFIDGPKYNTMKYVQLYKKIQFICTGFGVTPFISFIRHVIYNPTKYENILQINIIWIINDSHDFYMFNKTLSMLIHFPVFNFQIYFTKVIKKSKHREAILLLQDYIFKQNNFDIISGLYQKNKTKLHRPNFKSIFQDILTHNKEDKKVGLFTCGNDNLKKKILNKCRKYSNNTLGLKIHYYSVQ